MKWVADRVIALNDFLPFPVSGSTPPVRAIRLTVPPLGGVYPPCPLTLSLAWDSLQPMEMSQREARSENEGDTGGQK